MHSSYFTSAGNVDRPLKVLLPEDDARRSALGLGVPLHLPLHPHCRRDKVPLLGPDRDVERDQVPDTQRCLSVLRGEGRGRRMAL